MRSHRIASVSVVALLLCPAVLAWPGEGDPPARDESSQHRTAHVERPRDPYLPTPKQPRAARPGTRVSRDGFVSVQVNVDSFGNNIVGDAANEPSIAVDPTGPTRIAIGWRQFDNVGSDFRQAGWGYSTDGGNTWTFPGVIEPGRFRSDPVLSSNVDGDFFYNSLTREGGFQCKVFKSVDGGATWDAGVFAWGGDKQWQTIDQTDGIGRGNIYASWSSSFSSCSGNFTRSYDGGQSFEACTTVAGDPFFGTMDVGPGGELYVSGDGMTIAKSSTIQDPGQPAAWDFSRVVNLDGSLSFGMGPNPDGLLGQSWVAVDRSAGPTQGNVYMLASVKRSSNPDPLDVMFSRSEDGGVTWSAPVRVNDDPGTSAWQWFGTMSVAPNGRIDVVWLDTRNDTTGGYLSELFYSYSTDAGVTWAQNVALTPAFDPHVGWPQQKKMGDYFHMVSDEFGANLAYAATFNGEQDVYFARIGDPASPDFGRVRLDSTIYACDDTVLVSVIDYGLNTDDQVADSVIVDIDSDSENGVETITLTETSPASALFEGSIALSTTDAPGVLLVADGDTVTVTYIDADNGLGGTNIVVQDAATLDCAPPVIANVRASGITGTGATITWDTDEPADSSVTYGGMTPWATISNEALTTSHYIRLESLDESTVYVFSVTSTDGVGNSVTDDNQGAFYEFATRANTDTPTLVKDINPGAGSSLPDELTAVGGTLFFVADDGTTGEELWKSDGTAAGTVLVKDIVPGSGTARPDDLTAVAGTLFFTARVEGRKQLWKSDGTDAGTVLVKDVDVVTSFLRSEMVGVGGILFFRARDDTTGEELWKSDGTEAGTMLVKDIRPGPSRSRPSDLVNVGGTLFFSADDGTNGSELWKSDGTEAGTVLVKDINPGFSDSFPNSMTEFGGMTFFSARTFPSGQELWSSDGSETGTDLVRDILPGPEGSFPRELTVVGDVLFFRAYESATGDELWKSDGTAAGTVLVKDFFPSGIDRLPNQLKEFGETLFFRADDGTSGIEPWTSDGTEAGTVLLTDINPGTGNSFPFIPTAVGGTLFFVANDGANGSELWMSDGTESGTHFVDDINSGAAGSGIFRVATVGHNLFFRATDGTNGVELWALLRDSDGDGVLNRDDLCAGTVLPDTPTVELRGARFAAREDGSFDSGLDKFDGLYTIFDTAGCSGTQIIEERSLGRGHTKFGISKGALEGWIARVNGG